MAELSAIPCERLLNSLKQKSRKHTTARLVRVLFDCTNTFRERYEN
jgi:hypothetical protein